MPTIICFVFILLLVPACQLTSGQSSPARLTEIVSPLYQQDERPFYHGVVSADPLADRVIIWTHVTPNDSVSSPLDARWELSTNERFDPVIQGGSSWD